MWFPKGEAIVSTNRKWDTGWQKKNLSATVQGIDWAAHRRQYVDSPREGIRVCVCLYIQGLSGNNPAVVNTRTACT